MERSEQLLVEIRDALVALQVEIRTLRDRTNTPRSSIDRYIPAIGIGLGVVIGAWIRKELW